MTTQPPKRITLDKIASSTMLADIQPRVDLGSEIPARTGTVIAGRILNSKTVYNTLEDIHGRKRQLMPGDLIAGALGHRNALHGYVGRVPEKVEVGDTLNVLNLGGVIGECTSWNPDVGQPFQIEVMGTVMHYPNFGDRTPQATVIEQSAELQDESLPDRLPPIAVVVGSSMNSGKTTALCSLLRQFKRSRRNCASAKCTGVSLLGDVLEMRDFGASRSMSFMDLGVITTSPDVGPGIVRAIIRELAADQPDAILLELGDGILGSYGVREILAAEDIRRSFKGVILCASDPVGAWGGVQLLQSRFEIKPCVVTGPVTDNRSGLIAVEQEFGVPARNARTEAEGFAETVWAALS